MKRIKDLPDGYDTDDEQVWGPDGSRSTWGPGGLVPNPGEMDDYGEEALRQRKSIDRAVRRLIRDDAGGPLEGLVKGYRKRKRKPSEGYAMVGGSGGGATSGGGSAGGRGTRGRRQGEERRARKRNKHYTNNRESRDGVPNRRERSEGERREEGLDDLDLDLLGESRDDDHEDDMDEESAMEIDSEGEGDEGKIGRAHV